MRERPEELSLEIEPGRARRARRSGRLGRRGSRRRARGRSGHARRGATLLLAEARRRQRSTVKISYTPRDRGARWSAHGAYLAREGAQRRGEKGLGFTTDRDDLDLALTLTRWYNAGDERLFKLVVSPEHAERLNLRAHARALLSAMEQDLGTRLEWGAIDHYNTDHPHLHILVRGVDDQGRTLTIDPAYIKAGIRHRSELLATQVLGWRTEREILDAREQAIERMQLTELDRALLNRAGADRVVTDHDLAARHPAERAYREHERRRLQFLLRLGLAEPNGRHAWRLSGALESTLRHAQRVTDVVKSRARHGVWLANRDLPVVVTQIDPGISITGRVVGTGLADELRDRRYLLVEGPDRLHYILQTATVERARGAGTLRLGQTVTLTGRAVMREGRARTAIEIRPIDTPRSTDRGDRPPRSPSEAPTRERPALLPSLDEVQQAQQKPFQRAAPLPGLIYRGRLVAYAVDDAGHRYAVLDTGRELTAVRAPRGRLSLGRAVRATAHEIEEDNRTRRLLIWRLADDERVRGRQRERR